VGSVCFYVILVVICSVELIVNPNAHCRAAVMIVVAATSLLWPKTMHSASPSAPNSLSVIESDDQVCQDIFTHSKSVTLQLLNQETEALEHPSVCSQTALSL
jgi:hypothetical protein